MLVVFDLDGTLANCDQRVAAILLDPEQGYPHKRAKPDWAAFYEACDQDEPIDHAIQTLQAFYDAGHDVRIWTARSDAVKDKTIDWLLMNGVPAEVASQILMRPDNDHRDDAIVKAEWIADYGKPDLVFEDRTRVVQNWRALGIPCYQVAQADF